MAVSDFGVIGRSIPGIVVKILVYTLGARLRDEAGLNDVHVLDGGFLGMPLLLY